MFSSDRRFFIQIQKFLTKKPSDLSSVELQKQYPYGTSMVSLSSICGSCLCVCSPISATDFRFRTMYGSAISDFGRRLLNTKPHTGTTSFLRGLQNSDLIAFEIFVCDSQSNTSRGQSCMTTKIKGFDNSDKFITMMSLLDGFTGKLLYENKHRGREKSPLREHTPPRGSSPLREHTPSREVISVARAYSTTRVISVARLHCLPDTLRCASNSVARVTLLREYTVCQMLPPRVTQPREYTVRQVSLYRASNSVGIYFLIL
ncbi:hypothetical protein Hdeb2414_s0006g00206421 [Helianthus debilis subsp. tardiflorus]